jgi:hypothetical protein
MLRAQMEGISEGQSITVKYDPNSPISALMYGWYVGNAGREVLELQFIGHGADPK